MSGLIIGLINSGGASGTNLTGLGTDNRLARWDGTDTLQDSGWSLSDANVLTSGGNLDTAGYDITMSNGDIIGVQYIHDGNSNELIQFAGDSSPVNFLFIGNRATGNGPYINAAGSDVNVNLVLEAKGAGVIDTNGTSITLGAAEISEINELAFGERADHVSTPAAGGGYLWVRSDTPSSLVFTDDAGTDYDLTSYGTGTVGGTGVDNRLMRWDGTANAQSSGWTLADTDLLTAGGTFELNGNNITGLGGFGFGYLADTSDNELLAFAVAVSAVNYVTIGNAPTGNGVSVYANGDDANIDISLSAAGTGNVILGNYTLDGDQSVGAGQDNYVLTYDNGTGLISLEAATGGGLANVVEDTTPQLGGMLDVNGNALGDGTLELLTFTETASAVNHINITNAATGNGPAVNAAGDDLNIELILGSKGTGFVDLQTSGTTRLRIADSSVSPQLPVYATVGSVASPSVTFTGDIDTGIYSHGTNQFGIAVQGDEGLVVNSASAAAVNYLQVNNAITANGPELVAAGSDTNIDLELLPKGTGEVIIADVEFSGGVAYQSSTLTSGAGTKTMDGNTAADYVYEQSGASPTFAAPTNVIVGQRFSLEITDTTGSGSITWNACFEWEGGTAPAALSAGETRQIDFRVAAVSGTTATRVSGFYSGAIS